MKNTLQVNPLKSIAHILENDLSFLVYSTQKRNIAYKLQYFNFMRELNNNYRLYGSVRGIYIQQFIILSSTICQSILFCFLRQNNKLTKKQERQVSFTILLNKSKDYLSSDLHSGITDLKNLRDELHPERQRNLHLDTFSVSRAREAVVVVKNLLIELKAI